MPAEARIAPIWKKQKLFVAIFFLALGGWFWWDGLVGYPRSNERWTAYKQHETEGRLSDWPGYAWSRGWVEKVPHKFHSREDIVGQYVFGGLCDLLGAILLIYWATQIGRTIRTDEEAVYTPSGTRVPFSAITGVGKKHWDSKGIAKVRYSLSGRQGQFIVDDYKFETEPTRQILNEIEQYLLTRRPSTETAP
ncbi:hypothetical protein ACXR0O_21310 [Verrucomicrobiota bacterium sgz303538]